MSAHDDLREGLAEAFVTLAEEFHPDAVISLVKPSETYDEYDTVLELDENRFFEYSNYRQGFLLEIAIDSTAMTDAIAEATHVKVDDDIYEIRRGDTTAPKSTDVTWKLLCDRIGQTANYQGLRE